MTAFADIVMPFKHYAYNVKEIAEPETIEEALSSSHAREWKLATESEYRSLIENDTWDLVEIPEERTAVGCQWILKVKYNGEGNIVRFKSRLVARGYSHSHEIDFNETLFFTCCAFINSYSFGPCCSKGYDCSSNGCSYCVPQWKA